MPMVYSVCIWTSKILFVTNFDLHFCKKCVMVLFLIMIPCEIVDILLEMQRILRAERVVIIRDRLINLSKRRL